MHKRRHKVAIDAETCTGCSLCAQLCKPGAIVKAGRKHERRARRGRAAAPTTPPASVDDIMVVGVGGQGVIVAAAVIADTALLNGGLEVKLSETRGMSQRGGSVSSHIRIGKPVVAPSISPGEVDYLLAFEAAEGLRAAPSLTPGRRRHRQHAADRAAAGLAGRPRLPLRRGRAHGRAAAAHVTSVDGNAVAEQVGDLKVAGIVLVGALSAHLPFEVETWQQAIARNVPTSWLELNLAAFAAGHGGSRRRTA